MYHKETFNSVDYYCYHFQQQKGGKLLLATTYMNLENMLHERNQSQKTLHTLM